VTIPFWGRRLPRELARAALPEPTVPPGAQHVNPGPFTANTAWAKCPACHAQQDDGTIPESERRHIINNHVKGCFFQYRCVVWK
jgi:hypothetical protein